MQARGPLMIEHRLIERMLTIIQDTLSLSEKTKIIDPLFVDKAVDFILTYADYTHHGKEENIFSGRGFLRERFDLLDRLCQ